MNHNHIVYILYIYKSYSSKSGNGPYLVVLFLLIEYIHLQLFKVVYNLCSTFILLIFRKLVFSGIKIRTNYVLTESTVLSI